MIDERLCRRASFQGVTSIQLADGQLWWLPELSIDSRDPVLRSLVKAVVCGSDEREALRDELALTMVLLSRNYQLSPDLYPQLLGFRPGDPAQGELQKVVRQLALAAPLTSNRVELVPNTDRKPRPSSRWGFTAASQSLMRVRSRWSLRSH